MTRLLIIRHGRTDWNEGPGERFRGRADIPLSEEGLRQAEATAARVGQWPLVAVYSSPLRRCLDLARMIAASRGLTAQPMQELVDIDYGDWQGLSAAEARARDATLYSLWREDPQRVTFPNGESLTQVEWRAAAGLERITSAHPDGNVVLVTHRSVCKLILCRILSLDAARFWNVDQSPCGLTIAESRGQSLTLALVNDTCHLEAGAGE